MTTSNTQTKETVAVTMDIATALKNAEVLVPDMNGDRKLAIVSLDVLGYLASLLPSAPFYKIKRDFTRKIESTSTIEEMVAIAQKEIDFHLSVNMVTSFFAPKEEMVAKPALEVSPNKI